MNKSRLLFASLLLLLILTNVHTQDNAKKSKKAHTESPQQTQEPLQAPATAKKASVVPSQEPEATLNDAATEKPLPESCYHKFINGKINTECVISLGLSSAVILLAVLFQGLQIIKLLSSRSIQGLSLSVFYRELLMAMLALGYNHHIKAPTHTYGENISIFVQTSILIILYWILNPKTSKICVVASLASYGALGVFLYLDILSSFLNEMVFGVAYIGIFAKTVLPQIKANYKNRGVEGSFAIVFLSWAAYLARAFTTYLEVKDDLLLAFNVIGVVLYGIILIQFLIEGKLKTPPQKTTTQKVVEKKKE